MPNWTPQPESRPVRDPDPPGVVAGIRVCHHHATTLPHLRSAHGSEEVFGEGAEHG